MAVDRRNPKPAHRGLWLPVLLFCLVLGTFLPCLWNGFVNFDDSAYASQNPHVRQGLTWESLKWAWSNSEKANWHPVTWMSHLLDGQLFGVNPEGHHATSVLLHAVNAVLLFLLLEKMTGARWRSFMVAALFGLHPLRVESVAWVSERKDVLSVCFWMLTTWAYVRYAERSVTNNQWPVTSGGKAENGKQRAEGRRKKAVTSDPQPASRITPHASRYYVLCLVFFALGLLSKSMLVTLPFALLLLDYWPLRRWPQTPVRGLLLEKTPFLVVAAASSVVTFVVQQRGGAVTPADALSLSARLGNAVVSYARYLGKTAWPVDLCAMYVHPGNWPAGAVAAAGLLLAGVTALVLWRWRAMPYLAVGWFWFLGTLVPVIGLVQVGRQAMADRYTYIPSIGLWLAVVWGACKLTERWRNRETLARVAGAAAIVACIVLTVCQIGYWKDSTTLFGHAVKVTQRNWVAYAYLANALQSSGQMDEAIAMCQASLDINPYRPEVRCKLADILLEQRRFDEALAQYQKAVALDSTDLESRRGLGAALQDLGRLDEAIDQFNQIIRLKPDYADAYSNLGNCYGLKGRPDEAIRCFEQAVKLKPQSAQNRRELGVGLANKARWDEAIDQFQQAVQLDPADAQARGNLDAAIQAKAKAVQ
jgi:tetratricopeptide (TPR) repeat protein